jgi:hypothetical protein
MTGLKGFNVDGYFSTTNEESPQCHNYGMRNKVFSESSLINCYGFQELNNIPRIEAITSDSLIVYFRDQQIAYHIPGGWAGKM